MKNSWKIYTNDLKSVLSNWVVLLIIGGLTVLPSLYAWLNIYASWDPYGKTENMPVAVVNEDRGATVRGERIEVGQQLVDTLQDNHDFDWHFTGRREAMDQVTNGDYFSVLVIPADFSEKLASVVSDVPQKAEIEYYVNEKINSIAPKITQKGASVIVNKISGQFTATVNGIIFDLFNQLGIELENDLPDLENFEAYIFEMQKKLPEVHDLLIGMTEDAASAQTIIHRAQTLMPTVQNMTSEGLDTLQDASALLSSAQKRLADISPGVREDLEKASKVAKDVDSFLQRVNGVSLDFKELDRVKTTLDNRLSESIGVLNEISEDVQWLKTINQENAADDAVSTRLDDVSAKVNNVQSFLQESQTNARSLNSLLQGKQEDLRKTLTDLQSIAANTSLRLDSFIQEYNEVIEPTIRKETERARSVLQQAQTTLTTIQSTLPKVSATLTSASGRISEGQTMIKDALGKYPVVHTRVNELASRLQQLQDETDLQEIIELLRNDPEAERNFFEEPVTLNEHKLFPIPNYGTGMTPFYTVLSLWVGCLLLISLLSTEVKSEELPTARQLYVGRLLTFSTIGLLQSIIVTVGNLVVVGVKPQNPVWFVLFGLLISLLFIIIVYTLVSLFGDVGKALAIVLLVLQIAGSGGTYPVQLLPDFFQWINPGLPFTYAIDLMREAVGGIVWPRITRDLSFLLPVAIAIFLIGFFFKKKINEKTRQFLKKSRESGLLH
ncbi:YhgE/Pip domain-containing protein [Sporosarcina sp. FSL W7-1349]|uniref:YhgE/Pip domain-containing protein n=1 Tax=Sporosarcina sp. FSL W7-1349 TaxID=2921561 RepID=UPI0030FBAA79